MLADPASHDLSHCSEPTGAEPTFHPIATAPAKTADEALSILADEVVEFAKQDEAAHSLLADMTMDDPAYPSRSVEAIHLEDQVKGRLTTAALVRADTLAGLAAKGRAALAFRKTLEGCTVDEAAPLLLSMAEDAVRLADQELDRMGAEQDAAVIALAKRVGRLARMELRAFGRVSELEDMVDSMLPPPTSGAEAQQAADAARRAEMAKIGNVLDFRMNDPVFTEACEKAGAAAAKARAPFIAADVARSAEKARLLQEIGAEAAAERQTRLGRRLETAGLQLAEMKPRTLAGCMAMAEAAEAVSNAGISGSWGEKLHEAVSCALSGLRKSEAASPLATRSAEPDRLALESYRTWLEREHRALTHEMYPDQPDAVSHVYLNNPGGRFHFRGEPPASSRAERMLALLGVDWRHDPVAEMDSQHEQAA